MAARAPSGHSRQTLVLRPASQGEGLQGWSGSPWMAEGPPGQLEDREHTILLKSRKISETMWFLLNSILNSHRL